MDDFISAEGWVDYPGKNMSVEVKVGNIDYFAFSEYYPANWKPEKIGVTSAVLVLNAGLDSRDNDLTINCILSLDSIEYLDEEKMEDPSRMQFLKTALAFLKGKEDKPSFAFKFKTKMDSPKLDFSQIKDELKAKLRFQLVGAVVGQALDKAQDVVKEGVKDTKEITIDNAIETFKDLGDKFKDKFKGFKDSFESSDEDKEVQEDSD